MAKGKKTGGRDVKPGQVLNPAGRPKVPQDLRDARTFMREEFDKAVRKFTSMSLDQVQEFIKARQGTMLEMAIAACYFKAVSKGENYNLSFFMDRMIGKPKQEVQVSGELTNRVQLDDNQVLRMAQEIAKKNGDASDA